METILQEIISGVEKTIYVFEGADYSLTINELSKSVIVEYIGYDKIKPEFDDSVIVIDEKYATVYAVETIFSEVPNKSLILLTDVPVNIIKIKYKIIKLQ